MKLQKLLCALGLSIPLCSWAAESSLLELINDYRQQPHSCADVSGAELSPLHGQVVLQLGLTEELNQAISSSGYPMSVVRSISLSGPRDPQAAMLVLQQNFCALLLDEQFVDIGVTQVARDWRIVLARPMLSAGLQDWQAEGQHLLRLINQARGQARQCGEQSFAPAAALVWQPTLAQTALQHSREMAKHSLFSHQSLTGVIPGDRVELAGYSAQAVGENLAAAHDQAQKVVDAWLASSGHCANMMSAQFSEFGGAYAVNPSSDAGIYWTGLFAAPN